MAAWNSRGLRGSALEDYINMTNEKYLTNHLGLIQKIPTPITPIRMNKETRQITLAYFEQKSTVDYIGAVQGIPVCFDAKECRTKTFPLQNIHSHQMEFMAKFEKQDGVAFFLVMFTGENRCFYVPYRDMKVFWDRAGNGGRKSFKMEELREEYEIEITNQVYIHYLTQINMDLAKREE